MDTNNQNIQNNDDLLQIDISMIIDKIFENIRLIILFAVTFGVVAFLISNFIMTPKYTASISMCISNNKALTSDSVDYNDVNASITLVPTYVELIQSNTVLSDVANKTEEIGYTASDIASMINISTTEETQILYLTVTDSNPEYATVIANAIADVAPSRVLDLMEGASIKVVDEATIPLEPSSPNVKKNTVLGFLFGGFLGVAIAALLAIIDSSIKTEKDLSAIDSTIPVLGSIPSFNNVIDNEIKNTKDTKDDKVQEG